MADSDGWLSLEETATYLGMGKTALYALARDGRIPARKIGKKWVFEKVGLDTWVRANQPVQMFFLSLDFKIEDNENLRDPQRDGYMRTYEFFRAGKNKAILQFQWVAVKQASHLCCHWVWPKGASSSLRRT